MSPLFDSNAYYTPSEIADILKISLVTVRRKLADGSIRSGKAGRQRRVRGSDILSWLEENDLTLKRSSPFSFIYNTRISKLVLGDAVSYMANLPPNSIDLVFADPPYNLSNDGTTCYAGKRVSVNKGVWDRSSGIEEDHKFNRLWLNEVQRVLKESGTIFVSGTFHVLFSLGFAMQELGFKILNVITWYKPNAAPHLACRYFAHSTEFVIWASPRETKPLKHIFNYTLMKEIAGGKQMRDVWLDAWEISTAPSSEKVFGKHPTQKPIELVSRCILAASDEGATVLDPFCGSGTTGVAAVQSNRKFIGVDLELEYLELARKRIDRAIKEKELGSISPGLFRDRK